MFDVRQALRSGAYATMANAFSLGVSAVLVLLLPRVLGLEDYGYWQIYVFYVSFVGFLHLGWIDGIYLRLGGAEYESLEFARLKAQLLALIGCQMVMGALLAGSSLVILDGGSRLEVFLATSLAVVLVNCRMFFSFVLQCTYRIPEFSASLLIERGVQVAAVVALLAVGRRDLESFLLADVLSKAVGLAISAVFCRQVVTARSDWRYARTDIWEHLRAGAPLMVSNLCALLGIGVLRFAIEIHWGVVAFGQVSLMLSLCYLFIGFASSLGSVLFPILRRMSETELVRSYSLLRPLIDSATLVLALSYFVAKPLVALWLPAFADSVRYLAVLFPIVLFDGTTTVLLMTYLKSLRKEWGLLLVNVVTLAAGLILTGVAVWTGSLDLAVLSMAVVSAIRSLMATIMLRISVQRSVWSDWPPQAAAGALLVGSEWVVPSVAPWAFAVFVAGLVVLRREALSSGFALLRGAVSGRRASQL
ncbi:hypothetical protein [Knoellia aerolata]|uniref:Polysaccharide biosynthesis protein C-terminal domain-containing protein n=1 Tax=Knoellia aerolata DSM 18566 TaxID=1385519 RepID=A0A0A0K3M9_9MICO|nr:hypothetical protein [Knoellia aerolata]KGN42386.1 hypothetical protein N801_17140 [Knoellia aerolata DSM 18566]